MIDTHTHLYDDATPMAQDEHIQRALAAGVHKMYMPNCDSSTIDGMMQIAKRFPQHCFPMMGLHPCYVKENYREELAVVEKYLAGHPFSGVGEVGLDFYWDQTFAKEQKIAFEQQIDWALAYQLPVIIHSRSSTQECLDIIKRKQKGDLVAIFHCFSGTPEQAQRVAAMGCYVGIGGVVTFKTSNLPEVLRAISLEHVVLETDAPYLAPVPYRGKKNESTYLPLIADKIATVYEVPLAEVERVTTENAEKIFR
ncbi:MAG TPA: TatD family hydrolase [Chitinophagaceae bacterium]|nr:TatD family hydrolase [Chitinophagaceae bacterium]